MESPDGFSIVPPPPSYPTGTYKNYKVFPDFVEETMDKILSEEANLEDSRSNDWPFYSGADGSGDSPAFYALQKGDTDETDSFQSTPRVLTKNEAKKTIKSTKPKKKRSAAKRQITVIDLCSDDENHEPKDMNNQGKRDESDDSLEVNVDVNPQAVATLDGENDDTSEYFDATEGGMDTVNVKIINRKSVNVNIVNAKTVDSSPLHAKTTEANVVTSDKIGVSEKGERHSEKDLKEEQLIFASVTESVKGHVLHFIERHPFMSQFVQPVKRSARRQFTMDMCKEALSKGVDPGVIWDLIKYVRRIYLDRAGVRAEPLAAGLEEIPFGEEVDDEPESHPPSRESHKRRRKEGSPSLKNKRSKRRLLDAQKPSQPVTVSEVIEIVDDDTNLLSPNLPSPPSYRKDEQTAVVQVQSTPDSPLGPFVTNSDEVPNEVVENHLVEDTPEISSHLSDIQAQENHEGLTTVQVESTPDLPLGTGCASVLRIAETPPTEDLIEFNFPLARPISDDDNEKTLKDVQQASGLRRERECAKDEVVSESLHEPKISPQVAADRMPEDMILPMVSERNKNPFVNLSNSQKRKARRKLLQKSFQKEETTETEDDIQPAPPLQNMDMCGDDNSAFAAFKPSKVGRGLEAEIPPGNLDVSNSLPKAVANLIQENLFPDLLSEATSKETTKLSKNQKRQERKKLRREKNAKKRQERREKELKAQQLPTNSWLKHHNIVDLQETPAQALQKKKSQARVSLSTPPAIDPEPRKERKRKDREHRREQKRERKRKRESSKVEMNNNTIDHDEDHEDLLGNEALETNEQELKRRDNKEREEQRKRQERSLESHHNKDDVEDDDHTPEFPLLDDSTESHKSSNDLGEDVVSSDHDEPHVRVSCARKRSELEITVPETSSSPLGAQPQTPVKPTYQREVAGDVSMLLSTPTSQSTSTSRSRYGPLSPDLREWNPDF
ncbi:hypothetical protein F1880_005806 [Penicillium rolfsii]|nr:hypothetical protein F1880_005806 [Penicillium rolfsii]